MAVYSNAGRQFIVGLDQGKGVALAESKSFNLDNGAGTTIDDCVLRTVKPIVILAVRALYNDATTGTVAGGNFRVGTTVGGSEIVASTAYENAKAVGTVTDGVIVAGAVAANGGVFVRHTGVAVTQAGEAKIQIEYREA